MPVRTAPVRTCLLASVVAAAVALTSPSPAGAEDGFHPLDSTLKFMNLKTDTGTMPGFVEDARPTVPMKDYIPVGNQPATRTLKIKTPAEVKAATAELDAARAAQLAGKRPRPAASTASAASTMPGAAKPLDLAPRRRPATDR